MVFTIAKKLASMFSITVLVLLSIFAGVVMVPFGLVSLAKWSPSGIGDIVLQGLSVFLVICMSFVWGGIAAAPSIRSRAVALSGAIIMGLFLASWRVLFGLGAPAAAGYAFTTWWEHRSR